MTKLSQIYRAASGQKLQNNSGQDYLRQVGACALLTFVAASGCSGPVLHSDLTADPHILTRRAVYSTRTSFDAGDHGVEFSNPVLAGGTLIFGNQSTGLIALYPGFLNQLRWTFPVKGGILSELTVHNDTAYFGGGDGFLYAVDIKTGLLNWKYEIRNPIVSRPTVSGGRLLITTSDDVVYAFDAGTGKWLWHFRRRSSSPVSIVGASSPVVDKGEVLAGLSDGFLVALSLEEGQLKWEKRLHFGTKFTDVNAHPIVQDEVIYIPSYDGALYALRRNGGEVIWRFDAGGSKDVVLEGDKVYLPSSDGTVYCLNKSNPKVLWKFELDRGIPTRLAVTDKYIIVGSSFQFLYVLDKQTGQGIYRFNAGYGSGFSGAPLFDEASKRMFILSGAGNMYTFALTENSSKVKEHGMIDRFQF